MKIAQILIKKLKAKNLQILNFDQFALSFDMGIEDQSKKWKWALVMN